MSDDHKELCKRLRENLARSGYAIPAADMIESQANQIAKLREALQFYANPILTMGAMDMGERARAALKDAPQHKPECLSLHPDPYDERTPKCTCGALKDAP